MTSEGIYNTCFNVAGLAFQTPEALMRDAHFRSVSISSLIIRHVNSDLFSVWIYACIKYLVNTKSDRTISKQIQ